MQNDCDHPEQKSKHCLESKSSTSKYLSVNIQAQMLALQDVEKDTLYRF